MRSRSIPTKRSSMFSVSEIVFVYEKPTPTGDSKNSRLASDEINEKMSTACGQLHFSKELSVFGSKHQSMGKRLKNLNGETNDLSS